ncbi:MAG TPA: thioredoxin family protein [Rhodocyclaceae bacterium]|nr:thioredoxin family protein [Rhodocyclaceae bacterium]
MRIIAFLAVLLLGCNHGEPPGPPPYDETADAKAQLRTALDAARTDNLPVFIVFGANWCEDCRALARAMAKEPSAGLVAKSFHVVKVDVGQFDRNLEIVNAYGNPIKKGIPAAVVLSPSGEVLHTTRGGELADARRMGETGIYKFLTEIAAHAAPK